MKKFIRKYILMAFAALLSLAANAAEPDWSVNANDYQYDMTVFAALSINGQTVSPDNYTLAAFCGEECRGVATVANSDGGDYFYLRVRSNVKTGETITFRAYSKTADEEVKQHWLLSTLAFEADGRTGFPSAPYIVTYQIPSYTVSAAASEYGAVEGVGEYEEGSEVTLKAIPNEGYKFVDWSDGVTDNPYTFLVWSDTDISANFAPESYKVTYIIGDDIIRTDIVEYGAVLPEAPAAPEKEGYTFAGWSEHPETMPAHDLTITGSYTVNKYKLTYVIGEEVISETDVEYGTAITAITAPEKEGHTFVGWEGVPETMPAQNVIVTGSYTINSYTLTFKIDDEVISETTVEYASVIVEPTAPEKEGHIFAGWSEHPETMPASDLTITGSYTVNKYKLTYVIGEQVISETEVEYGAAITAITAPEKEGHTFAGWIGVPETMPAHDVIVTGSYIINSYTLTFKIGDEIISETTVKYASVIVEPTAPEKEGHTFAGWSEHPETMPAYDVTVTGSYTVNVYIVTYMIGDDIIRVDEVEYGATLPEPPEAPKREGYDFCGWSEIPETMPAEDIIIVGNYKITTNIYNIPLGNKNMNVYDIKGNLVNPNIKSLTTGVYILNGHKVLIK